MIGDTYIDPATGQEKVFIKPKSFTTGEVFDETDQQKHEREIEQERADEKEEVLKAYRKKIGLR